MPSPKEDLIAALKKSIEENEGCASDLSFMAKIAGDASKSDALYALARTHRVKVLRLQGQLAALKTKEH